MKVTLFQSHVLTALKQIPDNSVDMIITSPPYWGLRKYPDLANVVWDGDPNCEHDFKINKHFTPAQSDKATTQSPIEGLEKKWEEGFCSKCNAWLGQLGLEPIPELYLQHLKQVMAELKRVLKPTGTIWWNMGDTYGGSLQGFGVKNPNYVLTGFQYARMKDYYPAREGKPPQSKKMPKCLLMLPERFAWICISELGLILRNKICWYKPNHLPSSVKDRFTNTWEYVFLFSKSRKYFFNLDAVRIPLAQSSIERIKSFIKNKEKYDPEKHKTPPLGQSRMEILEHMSLNYRVREAKKGHFGKIGVKASKEEMERYDNNGRIKHDLAIGRIGKFSYSDPLHTKPLNVLGKNPGDLWEITTQPFPEDHFAVFPEELVRRAIKAGCPEEVCKKCGKPRKRIVEKGEVIQKSVTRKKQYTELTRHGFYGGGEYKGILVHDYKTIGWTSCDCSAGFEPGTVLDPFVGSGTTIKVAIEHRRNCIGIEIVSDYIKMAMKRCNLPNPFVEFELKVIE